MHTPKSDEVKDRFHYGIHCWDCKSISVTLRTDQIETAGYSLILPVSCDECGATWEEVFEFIAYQNLKL